MLARNHKTKNEVNRTKGTMLVAVITCLVLSILIENRGLSADDKGVSAGEQIYQKNCRSCHGPKAQGMASFPKLADKSAEYITNRLEQYRSGETIGPNTPLMRPQAVNLSDQDITNIANYISITYD